MCCSLQGVSEAGADRYCQVRSFYIISIHDHERDLPLDQASVHIIRSVVQCCKPGYHSTLRSIYNMVHIK